MCWISASRMLLRCPTSWCDTSSLVCLQDGSHSHAWRHQALKLNTTALQEVRFHLLHEDTAELAFGAAPTTLAKGGSAAFTARLAPQQPGPFAAKVPVEVNGLYTVHISITAHAVARSVALVGRPQGLVDLGAVRAGRSTKQSLELSNRAGLPAHVDFAPCAQRLAAAFGVHIEPVALQLPARGKGTVTVTFKPGARMAAFKEPLRALLSGAECALGCVAGAALGLEMQLGTDMLPFGTVVVGSRTAKTLQLTNTGVYTSFVQLHIQLRGAGQWPPDALQPWCAAHACVVHTSACHAGPLFRGWASTGCHQQSRY